MREGFWSQIHPEMVGENDRVWERCGERESSRLRGVGWMGGEGVKVETEAETRKIQSSKLCLRWKKEGGVLGGRWEAVEMQGVELNGKGGGSTLAEDTLFPPALCSSVSGHLLRKLQGRTFSVTPICNVASLRYPAIPAEIGEVLHRQ